MTTVRQEGKNTIREMACPAVRMTLVLLCLLFACEWVWAQTFTVLHAFHGRGDGKHPYAALRRDAAGNLYGTTGGGGAFDYGTIFKIKADGTEKVLHSFWGGDGLYSWSRLSRDRQSLRYDQ